MSQLVICANKTGDRSAEGKYRKRELFRAPGCAVNLEDAEVLELVKRW